MDKERPDFTSSNRFIATKVGSQNRLFGLTQNGTIVQIRAVELRNFVHGFLPGKRTMLSIGYSGHATSYHLYNGGAMWIPTIPSAVGKPGQNLIVAAQVITVPDFIRSLPSIRLTNDIGANCVAEYSQLRTYELNGNQLAIHLVQESTIDGESEFAIVGTVADSLGWGSVSGPYLDVRVFDVFRNERALRLYFDGHSPPSVGIRTGQKFGRVHIVSSDGARLAIGYERAVGDFRVAYLYMATPSVLYSLGKIQGCRLDYSVEGSARVWKIKRVVPRRNLERIMAFESQNNNEAGRIGAEIACCVATDKLGLSNVIMEDPSRPGPDLYTEDRRVVIEARFLQRTQNEKGAVLDEDIAKQLNQMVRKLKHDLAASDSAVFGYAIFSFIDSQHAIRTLVLRVCRAREGIRDSARHGRSGK